MSATRPRIVITGMGWITPLGHDLETVWAAMLRGDSGVDRIAHFDATTFPSTFAAQVKNYDYRPYVKHPQWHEGVGLNTGFALGAAAQAWQMAGLDEAKFDRQRLGIYLGSGEGSLDFDNYVWSNLTSWNAEQRQVDTVKWADAALKHLTAVREFEQEPNMPLSHLAMEFDAQGPAYNCLTACAASTQAIGEATEVLRRGDADIMIAGGAHTMIHPFGVTGFNRLTALSTRNDDYAGASRPFSVDRDGFVLGEGAGMVILESLEHAQQRGAEPLAEIAGYGSTADAYRITDMQPDGRGAIAAMSQALADAGVKPGDIGYIAAHGTGTAENDSIETLAIKAVFASDGDRSRVPPISSIKSMTGHLIAAAGVTQAIVCTLVLRDGIIPPTRNLHSPDPACDLDYVPHTARKAKVDICLSNSFGFGGQNDSLVIRRV
ncbi:MAG: beta-ketoacyl-[acyl-carrier-protein] synthase family protein [Phycisphaeraceae bacterium]|nr:beta-ketoacyl-[acyl-carrier-protein] synthase family protein [Phycisphaeraceae bacterium]